MFALFFPVIVFALLAAMFATMVYAFLKSCCPSNGQPVARVPDEPEEPEKDDPLEIVFEMVEATLLEKREDWDFAGEYYAVNELLGVKMWTANKDYGLHLTFPPFNVEVAPPKEWKKRLWKAYVEGSPNGVPDHIARVLENGIRAYGNLDHDQPTDTVEASEPRKEARCTKTMPSTAAWTLSDGTTKATI